MPPPAIPGKLDWSPFSEENLYELGSHEHWGHLRRIIEPVTNSNFAVTGSLTQATVDYARGMLDMSRSPRQHTVVGELIHTEAVGEHELLKVLLAAGVDPEVMGESQRRPSHLCCWLGRPASMSALFLCRPDMTAGAILPISEWKNSVSPYEACSEYRNQYGVHRSSEYWGEEKAPQRAALRPIVRRFLESNHAVLSKSWQPSFPTIAELAARMEWFAVKNLLRRQVVSTTECSQTYPHGTAGKTALQWAEHYRDERMAAEIRYYTEPAAARVGQCAGKLLDESFGKRLQEEEVGRLKAKIKELSETVHVLTSRSGK